MAPPQFPMYSPGSSKGPGESSLEPLFGSGPSADPGYLASLGSGTYLGQLRLVMLALAAAPVLILAIMPLIIQEGGRLGDLPPMFDIPAWAYLPSPVLALVAALLGGRTPGPLPPGAPTPTLAADTALVMFRQALLLRFAMAEAVILAGVPVSLLVRSEVPFVVGFVCGYPLLIRLALPTRSLVERIRERLESGRLHSHLWPALLATPPRPASGGPRGDGT